MNEKECSDNFMKYHMLRGVNYLNVVSVDERRGVFVVRTTQRSFLISGPNVTAWFNHRREPVSHGE